MFTLIHYLRFMFAFEAQLIFSYRHPEDEEEMEEDEDMTEPSVPQIPQQFRNSGR